VNGQIFLASWETLDISVSYLADGFPFVLLAEHLSVVLQHFFREAFQNPWML